LQKPFKNITEHLKRIKKLVKTLKRIEKVYENKIEEKKPT